MRLLVFDGGKKWQNKFSELREILCAFISHEILKTDIAQPNGLNF